MITDSCYFFRYHGFPYSTIGDFLDPNIRVIRGPYCITIIIPNWEKTNCAEISIMLIIYVKSFYELFEFTLFWNNEFAENCQQFNENYTW